MTRCLNAATACLLAVLGVLVQGPSRAAEIVVLTNLGVVSAVRDLAPAFERASGVYVAKLMQRLGIADELKDKIKLVDGVPVAELVAKGEIEIGMQQINVILPVAGIDYVGPLPSELQGYVVFAAGILAVSKAPEAARAMAKFMAAPEAGPLIRKSGMEPATR